MLHWDFSCVRNGFIMDMHTSVDLSLLWWVALEGWMSFLAKIYCFTRKIGHWFLLFRSNLFVLLEIWGSGVICREGISWNAVSWTCDLGILWILCHCCGWWWHLRNMTCAILDGFQVLGNVVYGMHKQLVTLIHANNWCTAGIGLGWNRMVQDDHNFSLHLV